MKHRSVRSLAVLAIATLLAMSMAAPAAASSDDRPLKGTIFGIAWVVPDAACPIGLRTTMSGSGELTHLGLTAMTASHCTPDWGAPIVGGVQTFVAANGDTLQMTYTAVVYPFEPVEGARMEGPGDTEIVGGTGRFAGASGEFVAYMRGILHFTAPMEVSLAVSGEVDY